MNQTCQLVKTAYALQGVLNQAIGTGSSAAGFLSTASVGLYSTLITPSVNSVWADITEASYGGYARGITVVWRTPINDVDGTPTSWSPSYQFRATSTVAGTVYGGFVVDSATAASPNLLATFAFASPVNFANVGDGFEISIAWNEGVATFNSEGVVNQ